jgi:cell division septum initiation protein DivIVA
LVDVFISYPRASRSKAEPIKAKLEALGLDCFFDLENIDGGQNFPDIIDRALRTSKAVLCCWSPSYFERPWCMIECRDGYSRNILAPVALEAFDKFAPPADLRQVNFFNLTDWDGGDAHEDWNRTLLTLGRLVGRERVAPLKLGAGSVIAAQAPAPSQAVQQSIDILADLRATWANFPAKQDGEAVARFLERVKAVALGSGLEFEVEHHVDLARRAEAERQARAAAEADQRRRDEEAARFLAQQREKQAAEAAQRKVDEEARRKAEAEVERQRKIKDAQVAEAKRQADARAAEAKKLADEKAAAAKVEERRRRMAAAYVEAQKAHKKSKSFVTDRVRGEINNTLAIIEYRKSHPSWLLMSGLPNLGLNTDWARPPVAVPPIAKPISDKAKIPDLLGCFKYDADDFMALHNATKAMDHLTMRLEEAFGVELQDAGGIGLGLGKPSPMWGTVGELIKYIERKL